MNTKLIGLAFLLSTLFMVPASAQPLTLCFAIPLTGGQASFGQSVMNGAVLAKEQQDNCSGANPFCVLKDTRLVVEDHGGEPSQAVSAIHKLLRSETCSAFVIFGSAASLAVSDILERAGKLTISIATSDKIQSGKRFIFRSMASAPAIAAPLAAEASRLGINGVVSVSTTHDGMFAYRDAYEVHWKKPYLKKLEALPAAGSAFDGVWYAREGSAESRPFDQLLRDRFPEGHTIFSANGYDALRM